MFGRHLTFVPLVGATVGPDNLQVATTVAEVKGAPNIALEGEQLTTEDESVLYHHYKLNYTPSDRESKRRLVPPLSAANHGWRPGDVLRIPLSRVRRALALPEAAPRCR